MFTVEQLEAFVVTCETGSFSGAARKLGKAQSVISQHIINMELDCAITFFDRTGRYPVLTTKGQELLPYAKATLSQHERLNHKASHLFSQETSRLVLAIDEGSPVYNLPRLLNELETCYPMIRVELLTASSRDVIDLVESGRATTGLIISELDLPSSIDCANVGVIPFNIYAANDHALVKDKIRDIAQLKAHRQLIIGSKSSVPGSLSQIISPDHWYADNYYILYEMVKAGMGWSVLPDHIADLGQVQSIKLESDELHLTWHANIDVIQHQKWSSDPLHQEAIKLLSSLLDEYSSPTDKNTILPLK